MLLGTLLAIAGLASAAVAERHLAASWVPGALGGITGGFGIGALHIAGYGDIGLLSLSGVLVLYGLFVGAVAISGEPKLIGHTRHGVARRERSRPFARF